MSINDYSQSELEPRKLSKEEIENPYEVIDNFFDYAHLPQVRDELWEFLKLTVSSNYHIQPRRDRANLLHFYEKLEQLVEAVHIIHQRTKRRPSE
jgi:hypothetical protein